MPETRAELTGAITAGTIFLFAIITNSVLTSMVEMSGESAENVVGALIFFSYIGAALFFSAFIARDLIRLHARASKAPEPDGAKSIVRKQRNNALVFETLALLSFASLSYHMLDFLIQSYTVWAHITSVRLPDAFLGVGGIFSLRGDQAPLYLWQWSRSSTLFQDFAEVIVDDPRRFWWTQLTLLYSIGWSTFMAVEGVRRRVPHLWAYYVLAQILPISFTQNLFCVAVFLTSPPSKTTSFGSAAPGDQFALVFTYLLILSVAPGTVQRPSFFFCVFALRTLLIAPYWVSKPKIRSPTGPAPTSSDSLYWRYRYTFFILAVVGSFLQVRQTQLSLPVVSIVGALHDSPAVSALGYDLVVALLSLSAFVASSNSRI